MMCKALRAKTAQHIALALPFLPADAQPDSLQLRRTQTSNPPVASFHVGAPGPWPVGQEFTSFSYPYMPTMTEIGKFVYLWQLESVVASMGMVASIHAVA